MRLIRVYVEAPLAAGARVELHGSAHEHVTRVLRLGAGDAVTLFNGDGNDYASVIGALRRGAAIIEVQAIAPARAEAPLAVTLVQGIARTERMDLVVQKATELGVAAIQPVAAERSVVKLDAAARAKKRDHWRGIAIAALLAGADDIELLVGPEGGLTETERDAARQTGYLSCRLGPRVLRSETAAIAALAVLQATAGDLR